MPCRSRVPPTISSISFHHGDSIGSGGRVPSGRPRGSTRVRVAVESDITVKITACSACSRAIFRPPSDGLAIMTCVWSTNGAAEGSTGILGRMLGEDEPAGSLVDRMVDDLATRIIDGRLPPGADVNSVELARRYGSSRTPVRE